VHALSVAGQVRSGSTVSAEQPLFPPVLIQDRSDEVLAKRAGLGDRAAFAEIVTRHGAGLFRYALRMLDGDHHAAEDAVQETLTKAWLHLDGFRGESTLKTWLFRMLANHCQSLRRRRRPIALNNDLLQTLSTESAPDPHDLLSEQALRDALDHALLELPWRQRASWLLAELEGLSYAEIADILNTSTTVIRGQLHRARATLAVRMAQWR
jgi:RNA polymerase sigma-70 factor (ECF subfamily)